MRSQAYWASRYQSHAIRHALPNGGYGLSFAETNVAPTHSLDRAAIALLLPYAIIGLMAHRYGYGVQTQLLIASSRLGCREAVFNVVLKCRATMQSSTRTVPNPAVVATSRSTVRVD